MKQSEVAPTFEWSNKLEIKKIDKFIDHIERYCKKHELKHSFNNYLMHEYNGITSSTYRFLYTAPKEYLANSKAFRNFYSRLDKDFKDDIFTYKELTETFRELQINNELKTYLQKIMKNDSLL